MSLFDIKKNADEKAAQELAERQHQELMRKLDVHPLVNLECGRDVRDSYFAGIVFASLADDETVDDAERSLLLRIGSSLGLPEEDRELIIANGSSAIEQTAKLNPQHIFDLLEEVAFALKEDAAFKIFVSEFVKVCAVKKFDVDQVKEMLAKYVAPHSGHKMEEVPFDAVCRVVQSARDFNRDDLLRLADWLGEDAVRYLMLDAVGDDVKLMIDEFRMDKHHIILVNLLNARRTMLANRDALPAKLVEIIESDDTWPVEFRFADYQSFFDSAGIAEAEARVFVSKNLLPNMKSSFERAMKRIDDAPRCHEDICGCMRNGVKLESCREFRVLFRYAVFMNAFLGLDKLTGWYGFAGPSDALWEYCTSSTMLDRLEMDDWSMSQHELDGYSRRWEGIFKAIESICEKTE